MSDSKPLDTRQRETRPVRRRRRRSNRGSSRGTNFSLAVPPRPALAVATLWLSRSLLAALWLMSTEILFWNAPLQRPISQWLPLAGGYLMLASVALDWLVRYRVRDIWGVFLIVGVFGILNGLLLNPQTALANAPDSILSHALGGYWLIGLELFGLWAFVHRWRGERRWRRLRWLMMGATVAGFWWGVWVRWYPVYNAGGFPATTFDTMVVAWGVALLPALMIGMGLRYMQQVRLPSAGLSLTPDDYRLSYREYALILIGILLAVMGHLITGVYANVWGIVLSLLILGIFWVVIWLRDNTRKPSILITLFPAQPAPVVTLLVAGGWFLLMTRLAMMLPLTPLPFDLNQFSLLTFVFGALGTVWMPITAAAIGVTTFSRQLQTGKI